MYFVSEIALLTTAEKKLSLSVSQLSLSVVVFLCMKRLWFEFYSGLFDYITTWFEFYSGYDSNSILVCSIVLQYTFPDVLPSAFKGIWIWWWWIFVRNILCVWNSIT